MGLSTHDGITHTYISYSAFEEARNTVTLEEGEWRSGKLHSGGIKNRNLGQVCIVHVPFWRQNINIKLYYLLDNLVRDWCAYIPLLSNHRSFAEFLPEYQHRFIHTLGNTLEIGGWK